jgi:hypothetical protein
MEETGPEMGRRELHSAQAILDGALTPPPPTPAPGSTPATPTPTPSGNSGAAADDKQRIADFNQVLTDLNNNQDPVSDMLAYQAECDKELNGLQQENQDLLASLQSNSSPANWATVSSEIQIHLQQMQVILHEEYVLQALAAAAAKANNNANGYNAGSRKDIS